MVEAVDAAGFCFAPLPVKMLEDRQLSDFWEFATKVRKTRSLAARASMAVRGAWLSPDLAVQRVHSWGGRTVRLLCVVAKTKERRSRLQMFFQRDKRNIEGHLTGAQDALDNETRILVKIPYNESLQGCILRERDALTDLGGLPGIVELAQPLYFEDLRIHAAVYPYCSNPSLQEQLEAGRTLAPEDMHRLLSFLLSTLDLAHSRGWLHGDLRPMHILLPELPDAGSGVASVVSGDVGGVQPPSIVTGWSSSVRRGTPNFGAARGSLVELLAQLPSGRVPRPPGSSEFVGGSSGTGSATGDLARESTLAGKAVSADLFAGESSENASEVYEGSGLDSTSLRRELGENGREASMPSMYSAPEQFVGLFVGVLCQAESTDVYRAVAVAHMALTARGPFGCRGHAVAPAASKTIDMLRRLCHEAVLRRAESTAEAEHSRSSASCDEDLPVIPPPAEELEAFEAAYGRLLNFSPDLGDCGGTELQAFFEQCLARDGAERPATAADALELLDEAWTQVESRMLAERRALKERNSLLCLGEDGAQEDALAAGASPGASGRKPRRILYEPPKELEEMKVL